MGDIVYKQLELEDCECINEINPAQYIGKAWREIEGKRQLTIIDYQDSDWPKGYEHHYNNLRRTILGEGSAIGAFDPNNRLLGFATINRNFFGERYNYVLLDQLFITLEHRNQGIGKKLFKLATEVAKEWNADKIYICAGSAEETISFYFAIGCKEATEINKELYECDPRDFQLEFSLQSFIVYIIERSHIPKNTKKSIENPDEGQAVKRWIDKCITEYRAV